MADKKQIESVWPFLPTVNMTDDVLTGAFLDGKTTLVMVDKHRNAAIGAQLGEPRLFLRVLHDVYALVNVVLAVGFLQFFKEDGDLVAIRSAKSQELKTLVGGQAGGLGCIGGHGVGDGFGNCFRYYTNVLTLRLCKTKNWTAKEHLYERIEWWYEKVA